MKKIIISAAVVASAMFLGGCAQMNEMLAKDRLDTYQKADSALVQGMYTLSTDGAQYGLTPALKEKGYNFTGFIPNRFGVHKEVIGGRNLQEVTYQFNRTQMDPVSGVPATEYVKAIKQRGNVAKLYKGALANALATFVALPIRHFDGDKKNPPSVEMFDRAPVIVEYSKDGRIVSFMMFVYQAQASIGAGVTEYTSLFMGPTMALAVENRIGNNVFANTYLREL